MKTHPKFGGQKLTLVYFKCTTCLILWLDTQKTPQNVMRLRNHMGTQGKLAWIRSVHVI